MSKKLILSLLYLAPFLTSFSQSNPFTNKFSRVDAYIDSIRKDWNVPGMAIAIVYKDQLIYAKGYGYRDLEKKLPFETTTLFPIASNTKLITATIACMLQQEGIVNLDVPVKKYNPALNFPNDELNAKVTLRDLLSHRTGLISYDGLWVNNTTSRSELVDKIQYMKPRLGFREGYIYNNMMYTTAGTVLEKATNLQWEDLVRKRIFEPLGMNSSCFTNEQMKSYGNYALSYFQPDTNSKTLKQRTFIAIADALGPAGTIKSSIEDLSHWMIAQLNNGKYNGKQVIPAQAIEQTLIANTIAERQTRWPELSHSLYGLGRTTQTYKGLTVNRHTGSIDGYYSNLSILPEKELAVFMVLNQDEAGSLRPIMTLPVFDILLNLPYTPWIARYKKDYDEAKADYKKFLDSIVKTQVKNTNPSHPLTDFTGEYKNPAYGSFKIEVENNKLVMSFRRQRSVLYHFHFDQFVTKEEKTDQADFRLNFLLNEKGEIDRFSLAPYGDPVVEFIKMNP